MRNDPHGPVTRLLTDPMGFINSIEVKAVEFLALWWPVMVPASIALFGTVAGGRLVLRSRHRRLMADGARLIEVQVPPEVGSDSATKFWAHLHALLRPAWRRVLDGQPHLSFEYCFDQAGMRIGIWVPGVIAPGVVESAVESAWPGARTQVVKPAPAPISHGAVTATGGRLRLARSEALPLGTRHDSDPLRAMLGVGADLHEGEVAAVLVLARPATGRRLRAMRSRIDQLRAQAVQRRLMTPRSIVLSVLDELTFGANDRSGSSGSRTDPVVAAEVRAAVIKATGSLWECEVRYVAATTIEPTSPGTARERLRGVAGALAATFGVFAERNWWARKQLRDPVPVLASRFWHRGDLLNIAELSAVAHLPLDAFVPGISRAGARCVAPAPMVPAGIGAKVLGDADAGPPRPVGLKVVDARRHTHILGATGSGKSTLMGRMILDDITARRGVVVIDPKGDLIADLLERMPPEAGHRTVLIDPTQDGPRPTLNVLAADGENPELLVDNLVGIFRRIYSANWGPRTDDVLRSAILTLQATAPAKVMAKVKAPTLADVPDLLTNEAVRRRVLSRLPESNKALHGFWDGYTHLSEPGRAAVVAPLLNKLRAFLLRDFVRATIADPASSIDLKKVLDGGILLVRLPKGVLGEETARLLGSFIVAATWHAASARARSAETARGDASLFIDEAHNFLTMPVPMEDMLAEARAYRLALVIAHQNLAQMPTDLREGISANTRNKVFFTCSPEDAKALAVHVAPHLTEHDLAHLGGFQAAVRLSVDGIAAPAFTMATRPLPDAVPGRADGIRAASHKAAVTKAQSEQNVLTAS